jgi:TRAP-type mannitol/chloroaromatic compound transport system permease large subunit
MGFILDWIELVVVSFVIFRPAIDSLDFTGYIDSPVMALSWITVLIAITLQTSFLTPPFGYALFFLRGSAPKNACVAAFPKVATWLPEQVLTHDAPRKAGGHSKI